MSDPMNELWFKINKLHLLYIKAEDCPDKIDYKHNLGELIREFLSLVPHNCKFHLTETAQILKQSVISNPDFSTFKLSNAWLSMHKYASNLLSKPWRREFTSIKLYSGFYKHQIEPVLLGGVAMLELMGYHETQPGHLELLELINEEKVIVVALDSLIAMVECQIIRMIYNEVSKVISNVSWKDVVEAREMLAGPPELISKQLISKLHTSRHCRSSSYGAACSSYQTAVPCNGYGSSLPLHTTAYLPPPGSMNGYYCQHYGHNVPISYACNVPSGKLIDLDPPSYTHRSPPPPPSSSSRPREESWGYVLDTLDKPSTSSCNTSRKYSTSNGDTRHPDRYNGSDSLSRPNNGSSSYNTGGSGDPIGRVHEGLKSLRLEEESGAALPSLIDDIDSGETRQRVRESERRREYAVESRTLERHRRESERDREREREREKEREREREKERERERQEREFRKRERDLADKEKALRSSISPDSQYEAELQESRAREEATYDSGHLYAGLRVNLTPENVNQPLRVNLPEQQLRVNLTPESQGASKANSQASSKTNGGSGGNSQHGSGVNGSQGSSKASGGSHSGSGGGKSSDGVRSWDCEFCTYRNQKGDICGMCAKSRNSGVELKPLESGGRQCPKCTLVNDKTARQCEACNESLENSATYI